MKRTDAKKRRVAIQDETEKPVSSLRGRAARWAMGLLLAGAGAAATAWLSGLFGSVLPSVSELQCRIQQVTGSQATGDKLTVLVSKLQNDVDESQTRLLVASFRGQRGFEVVPLCATVKIAPIGVQSKAEEAAIEEGRSLLRERRGDLLVWGEVVKPNRVRLWFINEAAECHLSPESFELSGAAPEEVVRQFGEALLSTSMSVVSSACSAGKARDASRLVQVADKLENVAKLLGAEWAPYPTNYHANYFTAEAHGLVFIQTRRDAEATASLAYYQKALEIGNREDIGWAQCLAAIGVVEWNRARFSQWSPEHWRSAGAKFVQLIERDPLRNDALFDSDRFARSVRDASELFAEHVRRAPDHAGESARTYAAVLQGLTSDARLDEATRTLVESALAEITKAR